MLSPILNRKKEEMNTNVYTDYYSKFRQCSILSVNNDIMVFHLHESPFENYTVSRFYPAYHIEMDSKKPFILALKSFFRSEATASVIRNDKYLWTVCLGKERVIYSVSSELKSGSSLRFYATPYFVDSPVVVNQYLQGAVHPAYENIYFYKNCILYLDNQDLPYPGGSYFDEREPTHYFRICLLSNESIDNVVQVATEWQSRHGVSKVLYMTRDVITYPKFINFQFTYKPTFPNNISYGIIHRKLSSKKPEHLIQDVLRSYYKNNPKYDAFNNLGLVMEWPFVCTFDGSKSFPNVGNEYDEKVVALSINGNNPSRVLYVSRPYDRYLEYDHVPATNWTPISFVYSALVTDELIKKVSIDSVVLGLVYKSTFFCLSQPLLEGTPTKKPILNGEYLSSVGSYLELKDDKNITILDTFKYNKEYSLLRVFFKNFNYETWCLIKAENMHPHPSNFKLPKLLEQWLIFFHHIVPSIDQDVSLVRLALTLSKHKICYNLIPTEKAIDEPVSLSDNEIKFYLNDKVIKFINDVRVIAKSDKTVEENNACIIN